MHRAQFNLHLSLSMLAERLPPLAAMPSVPAGLRERVERFVAEIPEQLRTLSAGRGTAATWYRRACKGTIRELLAAIPAHLAASLPERVVDDVADAFLAG